VKERYLLGVSSTAGRGEVKVGQTMNAARIMQRGLRDLRLAVQNKMDGTKKRLRDATAYLHGEDDGVRQDMPDHNLDEGAK